MPLKEDIARLMMQEQELRFRSFDETEAFALGSRLRSLALERTLQPGIVISTPLGEINLDPCSS